ncbi:hypothetical protein HPB48_022537 [Haemaphysalis longicornis]|uniref:Phosphatidic acid phosphatase type 2/haloperoxidase domain-containing protein n=1 Tax=Haemaphysalis longicornis TaxID=44386 RepID=A0A9J6GVR3_HAELO|nr:hypothetical protein HPB48_022537 [Haemaphysalis longicornis]
MPDKPVSVCPPCFLCCAQYSFPVALAVCVVWCLLLCVSRLYLGMHTVLDILVGLVLAWALLFVLCAVSLPAEAWLLGRPWGAPLAAALLLYVYPAPPRWTPARGDTCLVVTTVSGIWAGQALLPRLGLLPTADAVRGSFHEKSALSIYSGNKTGIEKEPIYDNARGSGLLCETRSGVLRTLVLRAKFTEGLDTTCSSGNQAEETVRHVVLECTELKPPATVAVTQNPDVSAISASLSAHADVQMALLDPLAMALGFHGPKQQPHWEAVEVTKRRLEH